MHQCENFNADWVMCEDETSIPPARVRCKCQALFQPDYNPAEQKYLRLKDGSQTTLVPGPL